MFIVEKVEAEDFMAYPKIQLDFKSKRCVLIEAETNISQKKTKSTGQGKSTIVECIAYGLLGKLLRKKGKRVETKDIIRTGQTKTIVTLYLRSTSTGDSVKIKRVLQDTGVRSVKLWTNGKIRDFDKKTDAERQIKDWLGIDFESLTQRFISPENVNFVDLNPASRFKVVSSLLNFDWDKVWGVMSDKAKILKKEVELLKENLANQELALAKLKGKLDLVSFKEEASDQRIYQLTTQIETARQALMKVTESEETLVKEYSALMLERDKISENKSKLQNFLSVVDSKIDKLSAEDYEAQYKRNFSKIGKITCNHCHKEVDNSKLITDMVSIKEKERQAEIKKLTKEKSQLQEISSEVSTSLIESESAVSDMKNRVQALTLKRSEINSEIRLIKKQLKEEEDKKVEEISETSESIQSDMDNLEREKMDTKMILEEKTLYLEAYETFKSCATASSTVRLKSIKAVLPILDAKISKVLGHLAHRDLPIKLELGDRELEIKTPPDVHLSTMSTGEKRSFDIAVAYALQDLSLASSRNQVGFFIADELFDHLDGERVGASIELLKSLPIPQMIVITHDENARMELLMQRDALELSILQVHKDPVTGISRAKFV